ncbi:MAG: 5-formyltetrahydrofolate cyclo-ligase [Clostridium sp.]
MKELLRSNMKNQRNNLTNSFVIEQSNKLQKNLMKVIKELNKNTIMAYYSFNNEVSTLNLLDLLLSRKTYTVILPLSVIEAKEIVPYKIHNISTDLKLSKFKILEPDPNKCSIFNTEQIEIILIPGVAFDVKGNRLGFGAGFYDRFLPQALNAIKIGICYDFQLLDSIPIDIYDIPVDMIITENKIVVLNNTYKRIGN